MQMNLGVWTVIGAGIGVAIGAATHNLGLWLGIGVALRGDWCLDERKTRQVPVTDHLAELQDEPH
jgi:hypothetical protein